MVRFLAQVSIFQGSQESYVHEASMLDLQGQGLVTPRAGGGGAPEKLLGITWSPEEVRVQNKISLCSTFPAPGFLSSLRKPHGANSTWGSQEPPTALPTHTRGFCQPLAGRDAFFSDLASSDFPTWK